MITDPRDSTDNPMNYQCNAIKIRHLIYQTICVLPAEVRERAPWSRKSSGGELDRCHFLSSEWDSGQFFVLVRLTAR